MMQAPFHGHEAVQPSAAAKQVVHPGRRNGGFPWAGWRSRSHSRQLVLLSVIEFSDPFTF